VTTLLSFTGDITLKNEANARAGRLGAIAANSRRDLVATMARVRAAQREKLLTGHGCSMCPYEAIPAHLPIAEKQARANQLWGFHLRRANVARSQRVAARKRARSA